jgi:hypothetical protein
MNPKGSVKSPKSSPEHALFLDYKPRNQNASPKEMGEAF